MEPENYTQAFSGNSEWVVEVWARNEDEEIDWGHAVEDLQCQDKKFAFVSVGGREQLTVCLAGGRHFTCIC